MNTSNLPINAFAQGGMVIAISLTIGVLSDYFFFGHLPGISFPLYVIAIIAGVGVIAAFLKKPIRKEVLWLLIPLIFFSVMVFVRASFLLTFLNIVACIALLLIITRVTFIEKVKNFLVTDYIKTAFLPFKFFVPAIATINSLGSLPSTSPDRKVTGQVIRGILMALPVLALFLLLFSGADLLFKKYLADLITFNLDPDLILRIRNIFIATLIFIGAYAYTFRQAKETAQATPKNPTYALGHIENSILLGSVSVLFFVFIVVQIAYLFGGESNIYKEGFTFAEYARRGFFELIAVAVVSLLLLLATERYITKKETKHETSFKVLSTVVVVEVMLIMVSAFQRLFLYEEAYGFTTLRLYSHAFILFLAVIFCILLYKIYKDNRENMFAFRSFIAIIVFLVVMNLFNPDAFIARRNVEQFATGQELDVYYLSRLSDDAVPEIVKALDVPVEESSPRNVKSVLSGELYNRVQEQNSYLLSNWQSLNLARRKGKQILEAKMPQLEPYKDNAVQNFD